MSTETKTTIQPDSKATTATTAETTAHAIDRAKSVLDELLASSKTNRVPTQLEIAKQLKKQVAELRERGFSFEEISTHLKKTADLTVSKSALSSALKKRTRKPSTRSTNETKPDTTTTATPKPDEAK